MYKEDENDREENLEVYHWCYTDLDSTTYLNKRNDLIFDVHPFKRNLVLSVFQANSSIWLDRVLCI